MWPSEAWARWIYDAANIALIVALAIGVAATVLVVWMGNVKEEYLRRAVGSATERAGEAQREAGRANEEAGRLKTRAADLENEAAQARLEQERLKQLVAWRRLTKEQHDDLVSVLAQYPSSIGIPWMNDPEVAVFAADIAKAFADAGWNVSDSGNPLGVLFFGLIVQTGEKDDVGAPMAVALRRAGIAFEIRREGGRTVPGLIIGSKPRPF